MLLKWGLSGMLQVGLCCSHHYEPAQFASHAWTLQSHDLLLCIFSVEQGCQEVRSHWTKLGESLTISHHAETTNVYTS